MSRWDCGPKLPEAGQGCDGRLRACALGQCWVPVLGTQLGSTSAAATIALPSQEHRGSPEVLEQIYRCNPILRYTSSPLYAPLLPFPYGNLIQSGEGWARGTKPGLVGAMARSWGLGRAPFGPRQGHSVCLSAGRGSLHKPVELLTLIPPCSPWPSQLHCAA